MSYFQGFLVPVPADKRAAYVDVAASAAPYFEAHGAGRTVECWGDHVPEGQRTDMRRAVKATPDEIVVFSWVTWPDRATCTAAAEKMMAEGPSGDTMPFDAKRMIYGGFEIVHAAGTGGRIGYVDGMVASVADDQRDAFAAHAEATGALFLDHGATRVVNGWGSDVPDGTTTDFRRAVEAPAGEAVVFGWIEWPDKAARDAGMAAVMADGRMAALPPVWNGPRAIFGGFVPVLDTDHAGDVR